MDYEAPVYHDSHDLAFRTPFGAVPCGDAVTLRVRVSTELGQAAAYARLWFDGKEERIPMRPVRTDDLVDAVVYECQLLMPSHPAIVWYYFSIEASSGVVYYCNNERQQGGVGKTSAYPLGSFQITVFSRELHTPVWFRDSVMYQIFVDRFCRADVPGGCPKLPPGSILHEAWDDDPLCEPLLNHSGIKCRDFFGGNLGGVEEKLPYLKSLGVGVIYLNPIFEAPSNHKYDTADYGKVDEGFGCNESFALLCERAREFGIRIILDGVFSHTGSDSVYFNREGRYPTQGAYQSKESPYSSWYRFSKYPDEYECWWNIDTLPNVDETDESYQRFVMGSADSVVRQWIRRGASGWRLDVADELPDAFLKRLRRAVKEEDPEAVVVGEVWEDASNKISYGNLRQFVWGEELDSPTNYPFRSGLLAFLTGGLDARSLSRTYMSLYENYPSEIFYSAMNMLGSHDVTRALTILQEAPSENILTREEQSAWRPSEEMHGVGRQRMMLAVLVQMTFPGVPCIYYGDEAGLSGHRDPFCRRSYPWGREDEILLNWYRSLSLLRGEVPALRTGHWHPLSPSPDVYGHLRRTENEKDVFGRECPNSTVVVLVNRSRDHGSSVLLRSELTGMSTFRDFFSGHDLIGDDAGLRVDLPPLGGRLLIAATDQPLP